MHVRRAQEGTCVGKYSVSYAHILHVYNMVSIDTLTRMLKKFVTCSYKCQNICDMVIKISEYSLVCKYSLVVCHTLILYDIIDRRYVKTDSLSCLSLSYSCLSNILIRRKFLRISDLTNPVQILRPTVRELSIRVIKYEGCGQS